MILCINGQCPSKYLSTSGKMKLQGKIFILLMILKFVSLIFILYLRIIIHDFCLIFFYEAVNNQLPKLIYGVLTWISEIKYHISNIAWFWNIYFVYHDCHTLIFFKKIAKLGSIFFFLERNSHNWIFWCLFRRIY